MLLWRKFLRVYWEQLEGINFLFDRYHSGQPDGQGGQHGLGGQWVQLGQENRTSSLWETTRSFVTESLTIRYLGRCHFRLKMLLKNFVLKNTEPES